MVSRSLSFLSCRAKAAKFLSLFFVAPADLTGRHETIFWALGVVEDVELSVCEGSLSDYGGISGCLPVRPSVCATNTTVTVEA